MNYTEIERIVDNGDFNLLVGKVENEFFDCKQSPYKLDDNHGKRELAKDTSSFANLHGGFIFIGIETKQIKDSQHFGDTVIRIKPFARTLEDCDRYYKIIQDWIYPEIVGIKISWSEIKEDKTKGVLVIKIPLQNQTSKPFLIKRIVEESKFQEITFGYAERKSNKSQPIRIEDLHKITRDGLFYDQNIARRFDNLEATFMTKKEEEKTKDKKQMHKEPYAQKTLRQRTARTMGINEMNNERLMILTAYPTNPAGDLRTLFTNVEGSIKRKLEKPPTKNKKGWNMKTGSMGQIVEGKLVRVTSGLKTIDLHRDGTLIAVCLADDNHLCWSRYKYLLTPYTLIEYVYHFASLYHEVTKDYEIHPESISIDFGFWHLWLNGEKNYMVPGIVNDSSIIMKYERCYAPVDNYFSDKILNIVVDNYNIEEVAYKIVKEIYLWFQISLDGIPYTISTPPPIRINLNAITP